MRPRSLEPRATITARLNAAKGVRDNLTAQHDHPSNPTPTHPPVDPTAIHASLTGTTAPHHSRTDGPPRSPEQHDDNTAHPMFSSPSR